ncbi:TPA: AbiH family protein [Listeria monocytogenes]
MALGQYTYTLKVHIDNCATDDDKRVCLDKFFTDLLELKEDLGDYIEGEEDKFDYEKLTHELAQGSFDNLFNELEKIDRDIFFRETSKCTTSNAFFDVITFNYTSIIDKCLEPLMRKKFNWKEKKLNSTGTSIVRSVNHIHGTLHKHMTLGVNDVSQLCEEAIEKSHFHQIIKPDEVVEGRGGRDNEAESTILNSDIIVIYGMSLGSTDRKWWEIVCRWLSLSEKHLLLINEYDENEPKRKYTSYYVNIKRQCRSKLLSYTPKDVSSIDFENQIFILPNSKSFFFVPVTVKGSIMTLS